MALREDALSWPFLLRGCATVRNRGATEALSRLSLHPSTRPAPALLFCPQGQPTPSAALRRARRAFERVGHGGRRSMCGIEPSRAWYGMGVEPRGRHGMCGKTTGVQGMVCSWGPTTTRGRHGALYPNERNGYGGRQADEDASRQGPPRSGVGGPPPSASEWLRGQEEWGVHGVRYADNPQDIICAAKRVAAKRRPRECAGRALISPVGEAAREAA